MSGAAVVTSSAVEVEPWGIDGSIILYGIMCDIMMIVPLVLYLVLDDTLAYSQHHQTYINMLFSAYAPLGITWWIVLADDSQTARTALTGAIEMAGLGPFALLWVGAATFAMSAKDSGVLLAANYQVWMWGIIYPVANILLIVMHYHLTPPMYAWLAVAPLKTNPIDSVKPWAQPEQAAAAKTAGKAEVVFEEAKDAADETPEEVEVAADTAEEKATEGKDGWL